MSLYLLDTNICIHFAKAEHGIVEKLDSLPLNRSLWPPFLKQEPFCILVA